MDDEDDSGAWAHQMELEQRQREEEELIANSRALAAEQKIIDEQFERATNEYHQRIKQIRSEWYGDHG